jgi:predicted  nucleic acid-binding Zn-ribbon protein
MLPVIEKLLILQDRDRNILRVSEELARIAPERNELQGRLTSSQQQLDSAKQKVKQLESDRKKLELEVESKKSLIEKYSIQQFQTKKNEEYRALAHEIEMCKEAISGLDDQQIELMEKGEAAQRSVDAASKAFNEAKKALDARVADLNAREGNLKKELDGLLENRETLASVVDETTRSKYERLFKQKGRNVVVGIQHGVCGGCHMQLSRSIIVGCQGDQDLITCPNCGRILFFTPDMDLAVAD